MCIVPFDYNNSCFLIAYNIPGLLLVREFQKDRESQGT